MLHPNINNPIIQDYSPEYSSGDRFMPLEIQGSLDNFADEKVIALFRGIHFLPSKYTQPQRMAYIYSTQVNKPMFCPAAYQLANESYADADFDKLYEHGSLIAETINRLNSSGQYKHYSSKRLALQEFYSNSYKKFLKQLTQPEPFYRGIFQDFPFTSNPLLSFSDRIKHPAKYGYGLKKFGSKVLLPNYSLAGIPEYPILGKLYGVILDEAAVEELMPLNVWSAHYNGQLKLSTHFRNDILSEREISIAGFVPEEYVVFEMPLSVPSFDGPYRPYYLWKYGLSSKRYSNMQKIFQNPHTLRSDKEKKEKELMMGIIEAQTQDDKLNYKNCIAESVPALFHSELSKIGAKISTLNSDYEIE